MKKILFLMISLFVMVSCGKKDEATQKEDMFISAENCVDCHEPIYNEWKNSMHAKSAPMNDKVHAAVFKMTGNDIKTGTKDGKQPVCVKCHVPTAAVDGEIDLTKKPIYAEGVTCTFCHKIKELKPTDKRGLGADAYEYSEGNAYAGTVKDAKSGVHGTEFVQLYGKSEYCNGCHERRETSKGVTVCSTYEEYKSSRQSKFMQCQNCHMKSREARVADSSDTVKKVHFHGSSGGHDINKVKESLDLNVELGKNSGQFSIEIRNKNAAHRLPTAAPLRQLYLKVTQLDKSGKVVHVNFKESVKEDKHALFVVAFKDKDGNIGVPPWKADSIAFDKRLKPGENRIIMYDIASDSVASIRAEIFYRLVPEEFAKGRDFDEYTIKSHLIAKKEINL